MKKFICVALALTLILGSFFTIGAFAQEDEKPNQKAARSL